MNIVGRLATRRFSTNVFGSSGTGMGNIRRVADFRSDTVTKPTAQMTIAMIDAQVGDDVYGEDPTVKQLEKLGADMFGMEKALYVPTCTMANLIAVGVHAKRGEEVILGDECHIYHYEQGGASWLMGTVFHPVQNKSDGTIPITGKRSIASALASRTRTDSHFSYPTLVTIENTHNRCGGAALPVPYIDDLVIYCGENDLKLHVDGARIMNAATASGVSAERLVRGVNSVSVCLSKGLGAPLGTLLIGSKDFIAQAHRMRKVLGGGMRQSGVAAASGIVGLKEHVALLRHDHARAKSLARGLAGVQGIVLSPSTVQTNIIYFGLDPQVLNVENALAKAQRARENPPPPPTPPEPTGWPVPRGDDEDEGDDLAASSDASAAVDPLESCVVDEETGARIPVSAFTNLHGADLATAFQVLLEKVVNVKIGTYGTTSLRAVTHHQINDDDVDKFVDGAGIVARILRK